MSQEYMKHIKLSELLRGMAHVNPNQDVIVSGVSEYSPDIQPGDLFIAHNNSQYCQEAIDRGAIAILSEPGIVTFDQFENSKIAIIECEKLKDCMSLILQRMYDDNIKKIHTIAVTGTDGKTSVAHLVAQALEQSSDACGLVGTLGIGRIPQLQESTHTTPPKARIAKEYAHLNQLGCEWVAIEASSHGIHQGRLNELNIHTAVLTNITRDHLDYHKTLDNYIQAKAALFFDHDAKFAVINYDDPVGRQWCEQLSNTCTVVSYSLTDNKADVYASNIQYLHDSTCLSIHLRGEAITIESELLGEFNVLNILAVTAVLISLAKTNQQIAIILEQLTAVPGRMQRVGSNTNKYIIVDYAHTPAALHAAITAVRQHNARKLICVFGCGGNRDQGKRPQMGEIASKHCDYVVITSDNPRDESPENIIHDIQSGCCENAQVITITDRRAAIKYAIDQTSDAVLIAGKGHEKYQHIGNQCIPFDDVHVVQQELQRNAHG